jgi:hypothetical protein
MFKTRASLLILAVIFGLIGISSAPLVRKVRGQVSIFVGAQRVPNIAVDGNNNLYLTMSVATLPPSAGTPGSQVFFTKSTDGGTAWNNVPEMRNLSNSSINGIGALNPRIAVTKSGVTRAFVVYDDDTTGSSQTYFVRSKKNANFQKAVDLSEPGEGGFTPHLAIDPSGGVNIVWQAFDPTGMQTVFVRSTDFGVTFSPRIIVSGSSTLAQAPSIASDQNGLIHVAWQDGVSGSNEILFSRSTDQGGTFSAPVQVSAGPGPATTPEVAADRLGGVNVVWVDQSTGTGQVVISRSTDSGVTFSTPAVITNLRNSNLGELAITFSGSTTYVAYQNLNVGQIFLTQSSSGLLQFQTAVQVSKANVSKGVARSPSIVADSKGHLHIVWIDTSILGDQEGLLLYSTTTNGHSFAAPVEILAFLPPPK